jgi:tetratricopeptide (TPR) repeat protein
MKVKTPIAITLAILFLAASMGILFQFRGRFSGNSPSARNSTFAEEAKRGSDAYERADFDQAIVAWDEAIRIDPNHSAAHRWRGDASLNKHELDKALFQYDEAIRLDSSNGMAYCSRGAASTEKGEFDTAIASFDKAIRIDPQIANMPFYKRYRAVAEAPWSLVLGLLVVVPLLAFVFLAFAAWPILRHRKPEVDNDF